MLAWLGREAFENNHSKKGGMSLMSFRHEVLMPLKGYGKGVLGEANRCFDSELAV